MPTPLQTGLTNILWPNTPAVSSRSVLLGYEIHDSRKPPVITPAKQRAFIAKQVDRALNNKLDIWLLCDGREVSAIDYPQLAEILKTENGMMRLPSLNSPLPQSSFPDAYYICARFNSRNLAVGSMITQWFTGRPPAELPDDD